MPTAHKPSEPLRAVITGASRGLGRAMALALAGAGYELVLAARDASALAAVADDIAAAGGRTQAHRLDVTVAAEVTAFAEHLNRTHGSIDLLINNAGIMGGECAFMEIEPALWERILAVNLTGPFLCCQALVPLLQPGGSIVNISSGAAVRTGFLNLAYGVSKAGLDRLTLGLAAELAPRRIACVSLSPPASNTETVRAIYRGQDISAWAALPELTAQALLRLLQLGPQRFSGQVLPVREFLHTHPGI